MRFDELREVADHQKQHEDLRFAQRPVEVHVLRVDIVVPCPIVLPAGDGEGGAHHGPVTLEAPTGRAPEESEYFHLGDGGTYDNTAIDTLEEIVLRRRTRQPATLKRALILSLDSRQLEDPEYLVGIRNFWLIYHGGQIPHIAQKRGKAYHDIVWTRLRQKLRAELN